jgi:hypothetical protein
MMLNKLRIALAVTLLALTVTAAIDSASAGLMGGGPYVGYFDGSYWWLGSP